MNISPYHLHHLTFPVSDLARSLKFYQEMLGAELVIRRQVKGGYLGRAMGAADLEVDLAVLRLAGAKIELMQFQSPVVKPSAPSAGHHGGPHLNLLVENLAEIWKALTEKGARFVSEPVQIQEGPNQSGWIAFLYDPDGVRIELMQLTEARLAAIGLEAPERVEDFLNSGGGLRHTLSGSRTLGWLERGSDPAVGAVAVDLPGVLSSAEQSVCGMKAFLIDERRSFTRADGGEEIVDCARVALLDIEDSPVHVHGETVETYQILKGNGQMVLGEEILEVMEGKMILIPPGVPHGLSATGASPVRVLMTFSPGMAPVSRHEYRDEKILHPSARAFVYAANTSQNDANQNDAGQNDKGQND
ncbi:MAG: VOC family protein [Verrucomicrobia bacterium]|nr:VOC family protein [Verrucomicrobiota bacterium]MCH8511308.1 VOC family protein [Kiritimatiellia bacterium]